MSNWKIHIYHNDDGSIQVMDGEHFFYRSKSSQEEEKFPYVFQDSLGYKKYNRGQSGVTFYMVSKKGDEYPMFISEFDAMLKKANSPVSEITGYWGFKKQGAKISLVYLGEKNEVKDF